jgi:hypothetical protein
MRKLALIFILFSSTSLLASEESLNKMKDYGHLTEQDLKEQKLREQINKSAGNHQKIREIASKVNQIKIYHFQNKAIEISD